MNEASRIPFTETELIHFGFKPSKLHRILPVHFNLPVFCQAEHYRRLPTSLQEKYQKSVLDNFYVLKKEIDKKN